MFPETTDFSRCVVHSLLAGIKNYSVMTDQIADNLHDLQKVAQNNTEIAKQVNQAESEVRNASITLEKLLEQYSD